MSLSMIEQTMHSFKAAHIEMMRIKTPYILISALAALFGCSKETEMSSDKESIRYIGTIESVETRAVLDTDFYTYDEADATYGQEYYLDQQNRSEWEVGDLVAIYTDEPAAKKTSGIYEVCGITDGTATFELQTKNTKMKTDDGCNYAVYPHDAAFENGAFSYEIPDTYTYTDVPSLIKKSLMVAKVAAPADETSTVELKFTNAQSILRLCFSAYDPSDYPQIKKIKLTSSSNYLSGTAEVKWNGSTPPSAVISASKQDAGKMLTVTLDTPQTIPHYASDNHAEVYLPVVPVTFPEGDLTIELFEDGEEEPFYTKEIYKEVVVARGAIKGIKLTMGTPPDLPDAELVTNTSELNNAIASGKTYIKLSANTTYKLASAQGKTLNITGPKSATLDMSSLDNAYHFSESTLTFNGLCIDWGSNKFDKGSHVKSATFNNCHIKGIFGGYPGDLYFNNCTFDVNGDKIWTYGAYSMTFRNCDFYNTCENVILMYRNNMDFQCTLNIHNCHFFATNENNQNNGENWGENAVVEIKPHKSTTVAKVNFTGHNTKSKNLSWVRITARAGADVTITVDGEVVNL